MVELRFSKIPVEGAILTGGFKETGDPYPSTGHKGTDWGGVPEGTAVISWATTPTKVHALHEVDGHNTPLDGWGDGSLGNCVVVDHIGTPYYGFYAHLQGVGPLEVGMDLMPGAILGWVGRTGKATGVHLHWALCKNAGHFGNVDEVFADPLLFIGEPELPLEARLERLERIVAAYGVLDPVKEKKLTGEEALRFADTKGYSAMYSAQLNNLHLQELANKVAELAEDGLDDDALRDDLIDAFIDIAEQLSKEGR